MSTRSTSLDEAARGAAVVLHDDRRVGVLELGDPDGFPVLFCHGTPGSRLGHDFAAAPAADAGVRLVIVERPGYGLSDPDPQMTIASWSSHAAAVLDALRIDRFAAVGYSGGAPYALSCAALLADRVSGVALLAGAAPLDRDGAWEGLDKLDRLLLELADRRPRAAAMVFSATRRFIATAPKLAFRAFLHDAPPADRSYLQECGPAALLPYVEEAFRQGPAGALLDYQLLARPWDIPLGEVRVPVDVWIGDGDRIVPLDHAEDLVDRLPDAVLHRMPGAGHMSIQRHMDDLFGALRRS